MSAEDESVTVDTKKEGTSFLNLNRYKTHKKKRLPLPPWEAVPEATVRGKLVPAKRMAVVPVAVPEDPRLKEMATGNVGPIDLNGKNLTRTVSGQLERYKQQQNIKHRIIAGLPTKEEEAAAKAAEEAAKAEATAEEGKVEVDLETEGKIDVNFTLNNDYITAITLPDTYFGIIS